jgi:hypothetical protein
MGVGEGVRRSVGEAVGVDVGEARGALRAALRSNHCMAVFCHSAVVGSVVFKISYLLAPPASPIRKTRRETQRERR